MEVVTEQQRGAWGFKRRRESLSFADSEGKASNRAECCRWYSLAQAERANAHNRCRFKGQVNASGVASEIANDP